MKDEWTTIYGDDVVVTDVSSVKADLKKSTNIYNIAGQKISSPKNNEMYIEEGKKKIK